MKKDQLYICPIGGAGEFGLNCTLYIFNNQAIAVDVGLRFVQDFGPGIGSELLKDSRLLRSVELVAYVITHGHEDHIGSLKSILSAVPAKIVAPPLASLRLRDIYDIHVDQLFDLDSPAYLDFGPFKVAALPVAHSIPDAASLSIKIGGLHVIHSGDFKTESDAEGSEPLKQSLESMAIDSCDLYVCDSTNAAKNGFCPPEVVVANTLTQILNSTDADRVFYATFSAHMERLSNAAEIAKNFNYQTVSMSNSISRSINHAKELEYCPHLWDVTTGLREWQPDAQKKPFFLASGAQGEFGSSLDLLANQEHNSLSLGPKDLVIIGATTIPGLENQYRKMANKLAKTKCQIITANERSGLHVSGHAYRGCIRRALGWINPKSVAPVHGTFFQQSKLQSLCKEEGIDCSVIPESGGLFKLTDSGLVIEKQLEHTRQYVDTLTGAYLQFETAQERQQIAMRGVVFVTGHYSLGEKRWLRPPQITGVGFAGGPATDTDVFAKLSDDLGRLETTSPDPTNFRSLVDRTVKKKLKPYLRRKPIFRTQIEVD